MTRKLYLHALLVNIVIVVVVTACGNPSTTKTEKVEGTEWNVTVNQAVQFNDTEIGVNTDGEYTVADTAGVNEKLLSIKLNNIKRLPLNPKNMTFGWTIPSADGTIWLIAYENEPILTEKVAVTEANSMPSYDGNIQVAFKFADAKKWEAITKENIGKRLAIFVNGQLMNAPHVNTEITSGNCSVSIPADMIHDYLPNLDLEKLKQ